MTDLQRKSIRDIIKKELEEADFEPFEGTDEVMFCSDSNRGFELEKVINRIEEALK